MAGALYDLYFTIPLPVIIKIHAHVMKNHRRLPLSRNRWNCDASQERPDATFSDDTYYWLRYVYHAVSSNIPSSPSLSLNHAVNVVRAYIQYDRLHVSMLKWQFSSGEDVLLKKLEDLLDA